MQLKRYTRIIGLICAAATVSSNTLKLESADNVPVNMMKSVQTTDVVVDELLEAEYQIGYATARINVRTAPSLDSDIIDFIEYNTEVGYTVYNEDWLQVKYEIGTCYISADYISDEPMAYTSYKIQSRGFKSFMHWTKITSKRSPQYKIQHMYSYTDPQGMRKAQDRYCVALGSKFDAAVGTFADLILENGTCIPIVIADKKSDRHTGEDNMTTEGNGCMSEFIVDVPNLVEDVKKRGDVSYLCDEWNSPVCEVRIYNKSIFE